MKIGDYILTVIHSGFLALDGGAMFGVVPKPLWQKMIPADDRNRIPLATRHLLLESDSKKILIDTGIGTKLTERELDIFKIDQSEYDLHSSLAQAGVKPEDITDVFLTHLHFDHTGGSTCVADGKLRPTFPNATYHVHQEHFNWACKPSEKDQAAYVNDNFMPLQEEGILKLWTGDDPQFDDTISFPTVHGHVFYQMLVKLQDSSTTMLYGADMFPTASHIHLPNIMALDLQPLETLKERKRLLPKMIDESWLLFFEHDHRFALGTVKQTAKGYSVDRTHESLTG